MPAPKFPSLVKSHNWICGGSHDLSYCFMIAWMCCCSASRYLPKVHIQITTNKLCCDLRLVIFSLCTEDRQSSTMLSFVCFHIAVLHLSFCVLHSLLVVLLTMSTSQSKSLPYHCLTNTIGNHGSVEEFYNLFNLVDTEYAHFSFAHMQEICFIDGMD